ncbi:hypothetical protein F511_12042 [Dorcoceras hygrometricum]|uniref:Uncharacterized protein n=1 Tax=Dorcoceras hygrometricum TaxID=472368 RepID=A0A2Z7BXK2_9LAMI|nr:hypothetical protein F511_12042 [Dorcoceras hygrometricum]
MLDVFFPVSAFDFEDEISLVGENLRNENYRVFERSVDFGESWQQQVTVARADIAFSARLSEEATRSSQHFGVLTIGFSSCAFVEELVARAVDRYDDVSVTHSLLLVVSCVLLVAADQQARLYESVEKRRRLN